MLKLYRKDFKDRGSLYRGGDFFLFHKGFCFKDLSGGVSILKTLEVLEVFTPEGTFKFETQKGGLDFLSSLVGDSVYIEFPAEFQIRLRISKQKKTGDGLADLEPILASLTSDWIDGHLSNEDRLFQSEVGLEALKKLEEIEKVKGHHYLRYARTPKGKLAQEKWRRSQKGADYRDKETVIRKTKIKLFQEASKWIETNPGKTFEDFMAQRPLEEDGDPLIEKES